MRSYVDHTLLKIKVLDVPAVMSFLVQKHGPNVAQAKKAIKKVIWCLIAQCQERHKTELNLVPPILAIFNSLLSAEVCIGQIQIQCLPDV